MYFFKSSQCLVFATCLVQVLGNAGNSQTNGVQPGTSQGQNWERLGQSSQGQGRVEGNSNKNGTNSGQGEQRTNQGNGNQNGQHQHGNKDRQNGQLKGDTNAGNQVSITMTLTETVVAAANTAQPLTVMTVTVTAPCVSDPNAVLTSVIAAPTGSAVLTSSIAGTVRKFVTPAAEIKPGLTSLPVAIADALGGGFNSQAVSSASATQTSGSAISSSQAPSVTTSSTLSSNIATSASSIIIPSVSPGNFASASLTAGATFITSGVIRNGLSTITGSPSSTVSR